MKKCIAIAPAIAAAAIALAGPAHATPADKLYDEICAVRDTLSARQIADILVKEKVVSTIDIAMPLTLTVLKSCK